MSSPAPISYDCFEELITQLRAEGHARTADILHHRLHVVAWTTGSELLGELGAVILKFQRSTPSVSAPLQQALSCSLEMVRRVWPDIR
jgi:hypothetical protein